MIRSLLVTGFALALLAPAADAARHEVREQSQRDVDPAGITRVRVENNRGDVRLVPSPDGRIHITALKEAHAPTREEAQRLSSQIRVETRTAGGQLVVSVHYPSRQSVRIGFWDLFGDFEIPGSEVRVTLGVPRGMASSVRTSSGDIQSTDLDGLQVLETTSGDVDVAGASGLVQISCTSGDVKLEDLRTVRLRTVSGDIVATGIAGVLDAHTTSGDLTVREAADSLLLGTVTGDVRIEDARRGMKLGTTSGEVVGREISGPVAIGSSSGDVDLAVRAPAGGIAITTSSGDIRLRLPRNVGAGLEVRTSNGTLQLDPAIQVGTLTRRVVTGRIGNGTTPIVLRSASGDIQVMTGGQGS